MFMGMRKNKYIKTEALGWEMEPFPKIGIYVCCNKFHSPFTANLMTKFRHEYVAIAFRKKPITNRTFSTHFRGKGII